MQDDDDQSLYKTRTVDGSLMLQQKPDGDCIYLDREQGCTIWEHAPSVCRKFDCHEYVVLRGFAYEEAIEQAARRIELGLPGA